MFTLLLQQDSPNCIQRSSQEYLKIIKYMFKSHTPISWPTEELAKLFSSLVASVLGASLFKDQLWLLNVGTHRHTRPSLEAITSNRSLRLDRAHIEN